jgi:hypothetical protein
MPTDALVLLLVQPPPLVASLSVILVPTHNWEAPEIEATLFTVITVVAVQPETPDCI